MGRCEGVEVARMAEKGCERCGNPLAGGAEGGICFRCLAGAALHVLDGTDDFGGASALDGDQSSVRRFGEYELLEELSRGGMGVVFKAREFASGQVVALKLIHSGPICSLRTEARFMTEIESAAALDHPHIVPILDVGNYEEQPFYTMKLVEGGSLAKVDDLTFDAADLRESGKRLIKVAQAVHFAHEHGIIHRDLKPSNVLLDEHGEPHVSDFGLAKRLDDPSDLTLSGEVLGTPAYMAPEQARGPNVQLTTSVDVYSLGALLYHSITGLAPFRGGTPMEKLKRVMDEEVDPPSRYQAAIDTDLETITLKCLEKDPGDRYPSALAFAEDLERWLAGQPVLARRTPWWERIRKWCRRRPYSAAAGFVMALLVGLLGMQAWLGFERSARETERIRGLSQRLEENLTSRRLEVADRYLRLGQRGEAVAQVAAILRDATGEAKTLPYAKSLIEGQRFPWRLSEPWAHGGEVWEVDFHPDGDRIVTASYDGRARIWSLAAPSIPLHEFFHDAEIYRVDLSPDGAKVVTGSYDHSARVWDVDSGKPFSPPLTVNGPVQMARFINHGEQVVVAGGRKVRVWDSGSFENPLAELSLPEKESLVHIARSIPGKPDCLLIGSIVGNLWVWEWTTGTVVQEFYSGSDYISDCVFNPSGDRCFVLGIDEVTLWDGVTWDRVATLPHSPTVWSLAFSEVQNHVVTANREGYRFWDTQTGSALPERNVLSVTPGLSAELPRIPSSERERLWFPMNYSTAFFFDHSGRPAGIPALSFEAGIHLITPDPYRNRVAVHTRDHGVHVWAFPEQDSRNLVYRTKADFEANRARFLTGDDGQPVLVLGAHGKSTLRTLVFGGGAVQATEGVLASEHRLRAFGKTQTDQLLLVGSQSGQSSAYAFDHESRGVEPIGLQVPEKFVASSPDGNWLVDRIAGSRRMSLHSVAQPERSQALVGAEDVFLWRFSGDSQWLVGAAPNGQVSVWNLGDQRKVLEFRDGDDSIETLDFSHDGRLLAVGYGGRRLVLWQIESEQASRLWERGTSDVINGLAFSPDSRLLALWTFSGKVLIYAVATGERLEGVIQRGANIEMLHFTPDGQRLAVVSVDQTISFWDPETGLPVAEPIQWTGDVRSVDLSRDGRYVCFGFDEDTIEVRRVHAVPSETALPEWFVPFAEAMGGFRLGAKDTLEMIPWEARREAIERVRHLDREAPLVRWAQSLVLKAH